MLMPSLSCAGKYGAIHTELPGITVTDCGVSVGSAVGCGGSGVEITVSVSCGMAAGVDESGDMG
jgi:hypothetical protein